MTIHLSDTTNNPVTLLRWAGEQGDQYAAALVSMIERADSMYIIHETAQNTTSMDYWKSRGDKIESLMLTHVAYLRMLEVGAGR